MAERETAVLGTFKDRVQAEICIDALENERFRSNDISVLATDRRLAREVTAEMHTREPGHPKEDAEVGASVGVCFGGLLGMLAGAEALGIPGLGLFVAIGPILGIFAGAAILGAGGGLIGALIGMGVSAHQAARYEESVKAGGILVAVHSDNPEWRELAKTIFERSGAQHISFTDEQELGRHVAPGEPEPIHEA